MKVYIGADHRGFALKNKLIRVLQRKKIEVEDLGPSRYNPEDDYPYFAYKVAKAVQESSGKARGIIICGSGIGVCITANKFKGIRCGLGFDENQVEDGVNHDQINVLALAADHIGVKKAALLIDKFLFTPFNSDSKYLRRIKEIKEIEKKNDLI